MAVAGLLTSAVVQIAEAKISSTVAAQANSACNFNDDLEDIMNLMKSVAPLLKDAEEKSTKQETVRLWLKQLKHAAMDVSDMMDDYEAINAEQTTNKLAGTFCCIPAGRKKMVLANKMKNMREKLRELNEQQQNFNFKLSTTASLQQQHYDQRETIPVANEATILGRDREKKEITDLLSSSHSKDGTVVLPIYGLGGMGMSTLAGLVYNDTQFKQYDQRIWVYVSQKFDLIKIGISIISQLTTEECQQSTNNLETIRQGLGNLLPGKKILIVLDDIWEENDSLLEELKTMLHVDKKGSMVDVIVTTRSQSVAYKICTIEPYKLQPLDDHVCWEIIKRSSAFEEKPDKEKLEQIGLDIAKKCGGVPLVAQALGYVLKSKDLHGWSEMNNSDTWNEFSGVDNSYNMNVLPSFKLSYERMPPILRLCFSYCAIFPKGHCIDEDDLIHQWVALDFIREPSEGRECIKQLLGMSFLQYSKLPSISRKHVLRYTIHDLVHDLARSVIGDELIITDTVKTSHNYKYGRYALLRNYDGQTELSNILPNKIRALHCSGSSNLGFHDASFSFAKFLRILDFGECSSIFLPGSIGRLKHLKCLIAPKMKNVDLPESIAELVKLQFLNLRGSSLISALPESIGKLGCLVHLCLAGCSGIYKLPESIGDLKRMVHFDMSGCSLIRELPGLLGNLANLQHFDFSECSNLQAIPDSLCNLTQLQYLNLSSCISLERIPEAVGSLVDLQYIDMSNCLNIRELPESFTNLRSLLHLDLGGCNIEGGLLQALHCLSSLQYLDMSKYWRPFIDRSLVDALRNLSNLQYLNLSHSIESLFHDVDYFGTLKNLEHLDISSNNFVYLPESIGNLKRLHTLDLSYCRNLRSLPDSISAMTLKSLLIEGCSDELIDQVNSLLHYSLASPLLKVRADDDDVSAYSNLPILEDANVGELTIRSLENVRFPEEARKVKLVEKNNLSELKLAWTMHAYRFLDDKNLLEELKPPRGLKRLGLEGYSSPSFPTWLMGISNHLCNLVSVFLDNLPTCSNLPPLGQLPKLEELSLQNCPSITKIDEDFCGGKGAFRKMSRFWLRNMGGLDEWSTTCSVEDGVEFMFPMLEELVVMHCPRLKLKPCPPIFRLCTIVSSDQVISSLEEVGNICHITSFTPSATLRIRESNCQSLKVFHHFPALEILEIYCCPNLTSLPESMRLLACPRSLELNCCDGISALPEWLGDLTSLENLTIDNCRSIKSLPSSIQQLTKLQKLRIENNTDLKHWCAEKKRIGHINCKIY